jgi:RimJ/RimL family protein N-acetyltransferase
LVHCHPNFGTEAREDKGFRYFIAPEAAMISGSTRKRRLTPTSDSDCPWLVGDSEAGETRRLFGAINRGAQRLTLSFHLPRQLVRLYLPSTALCLTAALCGCTAAPDPIGFLPFIMSATSASRPAVIHLRRTLPTDVPALFQFQLDPAANQLAGTKPRDRAAFDARWEEILRDPPNSPAGVTPRVIIADGLLVGSINIFPQEDTDSIGYWIVREHWGRGIATRAIALLIGEVATRPLYARVAAHNAASLRALERNGFVITSRCHRPATDRYIAAETVVLTLGGRHDSNEHP